MHHPDLHFKILSLTAAVAKPACKENFNERNLQLENITSQPMKEANILDHRRIISASQEVKTTNQNKLRPCITCIVHFLST